MLVSTIQILHVLPNLQARFRDSTMIKFLVTLWKYSIQGHSSPLLALRLFVEGKVCICEKMFVFSQFFAGLVLLETLYHLSNDSRY